MLTTLEPLHSLRDKRIDAITTLASISMGDYLNLVEGAEENLTIQRRILSRRSYYERLRRDVRRGGTLPVVVLAVAEEHDIPHEEDCPDIQSLRRLTSDKIYIVDGLQRTHHLRLLRDEIEQDGDPEELAAFLAQELRLEIWTSISFPSILYRMMLLNAAQTPMTLKHQLEIVNLHLIEKLRGADESFEIFNDKDPRRRVHAKQYQAADLVEAFTAFMKRTPFIDAKSQVLEEMDQESFMGSFDEARVESDINEFISLLGSFDQKMEESYPADQKAPGSLDLEDEPIRHAVETGVKFLATKPYLLGFAAAAGFTTEKSEDAKSFSNAAQRLLSYFTPSSDDPISLATFNRLLPELLADSKKIGDTQREFVFHALHHAMMDDTADDFSTHWKYAARRV